MYAFLNRLVVNSHNRAGWEYATGRPIREETFDPERQIRFSQIDTNTLNEWRMYSTASAFGVSPDDLKPDPKKKEADERAKELLLSNLTDEQKKTFTDKGYFECVGNRTGKTYRIHNYRNINTRCGNDKYCVVQGNDVPLSDQLLTEKMLIENDEDKFLKVANKFSQG